MPIRNEKRAERGFTLLEVMIALAIIAGLLVTLIYTLNYHLGIAQSHEFITVATLLAKTKLTEAAVNPSVTTGNFPDPYSDYLFVTTMKETQYPGLSQITVSVSRGGERLSISDLVEKKR